MSYLWWDCLKSDGPHILFVLILMPCSLVLVVVGGIFNVGPIYTVSYGDGWVIHCRCRNTVFKGLSLTWAPRHKGRNLRTPPPTDRPWRKYWGKKQFVFIFQIVSPATRHSWRVHLTRAITSILPDRKSFLVCLDSHLVLFFYIKK